LIAQRQTSALTTAVAASLISASSLAAAAAISRATAVDDKEEEQGQTCGCKRDRESDELPTDNDLIRLQLA
jgi:Spy/CpxP family protein refolding chaperone